MEFSRDGRRLETHAGAGKTRLWDTRTGLLLSAPFLPSGVRLSDFPTVPLPVPPWLPELAEAVACKRLNSTRVLEFVPDAGLWRLEQILVKSPAQDFYTRWAKWFFADPSQRTNSPFSSATASGKH